MKRLLRVVFGTLNLLFTSGWLLAQAGQVTVPRVELMPSQPSPYNMRNWSQVAMRYDSFVYDLAKTGQYLPLTFLGPSGINYPQNPTYRMHTYVGTNSPFGNEAINVLPSLVSASLVGADKSNQFGQNWLLLSQDFFNKNNGQNIYLNNPGATSGGDWWYDLMPNVFFYQLYDLYPDLGGDSDFQFTAISDRFLESVRAMGGNDAPWNPAYMNYRAWNFQTMQPNANGVPEPEAAGAYAWVLYNAWKTTGNPEYLKGAEWSMEFLNEWTTNPSYELMLPYGTLTAAKMNAELGTKYDVEKMVNWSFDRGPLRGWGTIVGTWGGFDVSGLVGEANDNGNDYAFQLNGVQQAAALVPMVRYDKRYARAIGKWVLNLANATRLFYPGFLPSNLQDASAWSTANDPQQVMGYEALRELWQGQSPFATGDALQGGWAATNLSLYSTSSIGYLGCLVEKTNVDQILRLDLLKTDFYGAEAYPTYLLYNPYPTAKLVQVDGGSNPVDVYNALTETFVQQNVSGTLSLAIPANQAILITLAPAGGVVTYDKNRMLIDGVVVDYDQHVLPFSATPRIKALAAVKNPLEIGDSTAVYATVEDTDSGNITYTWSVTSGAINGTGATVNYLPPAVSGNPEIKLIATDPEGNADTATLLLSVVPEINDAPQIVSIEKNPAYVAPGGVVQLTCVATDANNDPLNYVWSAASGLLSGSGSSVTWTAPVTQGIYTISVVVSDDEGLTAQTTTTVLVKNFTAGSGDIIADYPFTGNANDVSGNQLNGTSNGALLVPGIDGTPQSAYYFNGGSQHILVANDPLLNFQDGITVSCWFKANDLPEKESFLLSHGSWQNRWKISITPEKHLRWTVNTLNTVADLDATVTLETDSFYHAVLTYDGSLLAIYLNGELQTYKFLTGKIRTTSVPLLMGQMLPGQPEYNFKGVIDAVKIFDYALVPDAVELLYEQETSPAYEPLAGTKLGLYPNPVAEILTVQWPGTVGAEINVEVFDLNGRMMIQRQTTGNETMDIDVSTCRSGIYVVVLRSVQGLVASRFVKI
ncbi:MAG: T9SS type A sorting domain-containing protein [Saprospiraceae bacterium]|nr:T9SS type A sorting domain-containing protein [Saprospiraceae bacterium]